MARRERRAYPQRSVRSEQRRQTAQSALARRVASLFGLAGVAPQSQTTEVAEGNRGGWRAGEQAGMLLRRVLARPKIEATRGTWVFQQTPKRVQMQPASRAELSRMRFSRFLESAASHSDRSRDGVSPPK